MRRKDVNHPPEPNRLIRARGACKHTQQPFDIFGKFVPFAESAGARFFRRMNNGEFTPARILWHGVDEWEYIEAPGLAIEPRVLAVEKEAAS